MTAEIDITKYSYQETIDGSKVEGVFQEPRHSSTPSHIEAGIHVTSNADHKTDPVGYMVAKCIPSEATDNGWERLAKLGASLDEGWGQKNSPSLIGYIELQPRTIRSLGKERIKYLFEVLCHIWKEDIKFESSTTRITSHPAYELIVSLGPLMIPFILDEVRKGGNHWSKALRVLTEHTPSEEDRVNSKKLRGSWLRWAETHQEFIEYQLEQMDIDQPWATL